MTADTLITDNALASVLASATEARRQCLSLIDLLDQRGGPFISNSDDNNHDKSSSDNEVLAQAERQLHARLTILRGLNRKAILSVRETKAETSEARQEIDSLHLQLQNLYYEQRHLHGEIRGCEDFEHKYTTLPMIPVEDFLAAHPEYVDADEHALTIARIRDEHAARQELEGRRLELMKRKEALLKETGAKKEELGKLDAELEAWIGGKEGVGKIFEGRERRTVEGEGK